MAGKTLPPEGPQSARSRACGLRLFSASNREPRERSEQRRARPHLHFPDRAQPRANMRLQPPPPAGGRLGGLGALQPCALAAALPHSAFQLHSTLPGPGLSPRSLPLSPARLLVQPKSQLLSEASPEPKTCPGPSFPGEPRSRINGQVLAPKYQFQILPP